MDVEQRARELLASVTREMYPDDIANRYVIDKLLADELDLISARAAVRAIIAALTPPDGYVLVIPEPVAWQQRRRRRSGGDWSEWKSWLKAHGFPPKVGVMEEMYVAEYRPLYAARPEVKP